MSGGGAGEGPNPQSLPLIYIRGVVMPLGWAWPRRDPAPCVPRQVKRSTLNPHAKEFSPGRPLVRGRGLGGRGPGAWPPLFKSWPLPLLFSPFFPPFLGQGPARSRPLPHAPPLPHPGGTSGWRRRGRGRKRKGRGRPGGGGAFPGPSPPLHLLHPPAPRWPRPRPGEPLPPFAAGDSGGKGAGLSPDHAPFSILGPPDFPFSHFRLRFREIPRGQR